MQYANLLQIKFNFFVVYGKVWLFKNGIRLSAGLLCSKVNIMSDYALLMKLVVECLSNAASYIKCHDTIFVSADIDRMQEVFFSSNGTV